MKKILLPSLILIAIFGFKIIKTPSNAKDIRKKVEEVINSDLIKNQKMPLYLVTVTLDNQIYFECNIERKFLNIIPCQKLENKKNRVIRKLILI